MIEEGKRESRLLQIRLTQDQRRLDRLLQATRIQFDFNVGEIVVRHAGSLIINLKPFYAVIGDRSPDEVERALSEFCAKAVIGLLTRANQAFISNSASNLQTFMRVIDKLSELTCLTLHVDRHAAEGSRLQDGAQDSDASSEGDCSGRVCRRCSGSRCRPAVLRLARGR